VQPRGGKNWSRTGDQQTAVAVNVAEFDGGGVLQRADAEPDDAESAIPFGIRDFGAGMDGLGDRADRGAGAHLQRGAAANQQEVAEAFFAFDDHAVGILLERGAVVFGFASDLLSRNSSRGVCGDFNGDDAGEQHHERGVVGGDCAGGAAANQRDLFWESEFGVWRMDFVGRVGRWEDC